MVKLWRLRLIWCRKWLTVKALAAFADLWPRLMGGLCHSGGIDLAACQCQTRRTRKGTGVVGWDGAAPIVIGVMSVTAKLRSGPCMTQDPSDNGVGPPLCTQVVVQNAVSASSAAFKEPRLPSWTDRSQSTNDSESSLERLALSPP